MKSLEELRAELTHHRMEVVAAESGLSINTVRRYAAGVVENPRLSSVKLLSEWLDRQAAKVA